MQDSKKDLPSTTNRVFQKNVLIYGGSGSLGRGLVKHFKDHIWKVISIGTWKAPGVVAVSILLGIYHI